MKKLIFIIFTFFSIALLSCGGEEKKVKEPVPEDILSREKMTDVLTDVQLLEATMKERLLRKEDPQSFYTIYYLQIFKKHEVAKESFVKSFDYWASRDEEMEEIYNEVIKRLAMMEDPIMRDQ